MRTHRLPSCYRKSKINKYITIMPPDLALCLTLISSNYPSLEHIFIVPKVFEPSKFYCIFNPLEIDFLIFETETVLVFSGAGT